MKWTIYSDGGARGNPGIPGGGVVIQRDGLVIKEIAKKFGDAMRYVRSATEDIKREINVDQDLIQKPTHSYNTSKRAPSEKPKEDSTIPDNQNENTPKGEQDNKTDNL